MGRLTPTHLQPLRPLQDRHGDAIAAQLILVAAGDTTSGAFALPIDDALYVGWVATAKNHRGQGLAELVIRKSLEDARSETGLERTVLHATKDGQPVYARMGYRPVVKFPCYAPK
jgi:predicted GNAT family N-acyltransferase